MAKSIENTARAATASVKENRDLLIEDLKRVINDAKNLADDAKDASGAAIHDKIHSAQAELERYIAAVRGTSDDVATEVIRQRDSLEETIKAHPWRSVAIAAAIGAVIDRLIR